MQNYGADENVKTLCEAIVRHQIAQHKLNEVLANRDKIRDALKKEI